MQRITRTALNAPTLLKLADLTQEVVSAPDPQAKAQARWSSKPEETFLVVRSVLHRMAPGRSRCMYCEDSLGTDIEHFWPKGTYPARTFEWTNYLLACSHCNSNLKRDQFPTDATGTPLLIDPTADDPTQHLTFVPSTGQFVAKGPKGPESIRVFGLNDDVVPRKLPRGRRQALLALLGLLRDYDRVVANDPARAAELREAVCEHPFGAVLFWLIEVAQRRAGATVLGQDVVDLVQRHGVATWI
jgi:uncharacterized protein (TIGR02646 family)